MNRFAQLTKAESIAFLAAVLEWEREYIIADLWRRLGVKPPPKQ